MFITIQTGQAWTDPSYGEEGFGDSFMNARVVEASSKNFCYICIISIAIDQKMLTSFVHVFLCFVGSTFGLSK